MRKHYIQDQFLSQFIGQTVRSVLVVAGVATFIIVGLSVNLGDVSSFENVMALLEARMS
jgi:hypothetical protein